MEKFISHTGVGVPLRRSNVDTDQIIPAVYLKRVTRTGFEDALFAAWRGDPEFVLNQDAYKNGSVLIAGPDFGTGSSRDWAAKGTVMLGVKAVITESFERIHRSNLIGMGVLPLQFPAGESYESLGLNGTETYDIAGVEKLNEGVTPKTVHVTATHEDGSKTEFDAVVRIDTPGEADYYRNGGILQYVLRNLMK